MRGMTWVMYQTGPAITTFFLNRQEPTGAMQSRRYWIRREERGCEYFRLVSRPALS